MQLDWIQGDRGHAPRLSVERSDECQGAGGLSPGSGEFVRRLISTISRNRGDQLERQGPRCITCLLHCSDLHSYNGLLFRCRMSYPLRRPSGHRIRPARWPRPHTNLATVRCRQPRSDRSRCPSIPYKPPLVHLAFDTITPAHLAIALSPATMTTPPLETFQLGHYTVPRLWNGLWQLSSNAWGSAPSAKIRRHMAQYAEHGYIAFGT